MPYKDSLYNVIVDSMQKASRITSDSLSHYFQQNIDRVSKEHFDLINKVDSFYNNSWSKVMWFVTAATAVTGLILPYIISYLQNKRLQAEMKDLAHTIVTEEIKKQKEEFTRVINSVDSNTFYLQGMLFHEKGQYSKSVSLIAKAIELGLISEKYFNLATYINAIHSSLININEQQLKDVKEIYDVDLKELLTKVKNTKFTGATNEIYKTIEMYENKKRQFNIV